MLYYANLLGACRNDIIDIVDVIIPINLFMYFLAMPSLLHPIILFILYKKKNIFRKCHFVS